MRARRGPPSPTSASPTPISPRRGISQLVAGSEGALATLGLVINPGASQGVAAALVANDDGLEVQIRSELDPDRTKTHPGFFSAFPAFEPTLAASLPAHSLGYVGFGDPGKTLKSLLEPGERRAAGVGSGGRRPAQAGEAIWALSISRRTSCPRSAARGRSLCSRRRTRPARMGEEAMARSCPARRRRSWSFWRATSTPSGPARRWPAWRARSPRRSTPPSGPRLPRSASTRSVT